MLDLVFDFPAGVTVAHAFVENGVFPHEVTVAWGLNGFTLENLVGMAAAALQRQSAPDLTDVWLSHWRGPRTA